MAVHPAEADQGDTGTAVTNASGQATFTWVGDGGEGTDTVQASFTPAAGGTRSATATVIWVFAPPISLFPVEGLPLVLAASAGVLRYWRRRLRPA